MIFGVVWQIYIFCSWECFSLLFTTSYKLKCMPVTFLLFLVIFTTLYSVVAPWNWKYLNIPRLIFLVIVCFSTNILRVKVWVGHCRQLLIHRNVKLLYFITRNNFFYTHENFILVYRHDSKFNVDLIKGQVPPPGENHMLVGEVNGREVNAPQIPVRLRAKSLWSGTWLKALL